MRHARSQPRQLTAIESLQVEETLTGLATSYSLIGNKAPVGAKAKMHELEAGRIFDLLSRSDNTAIQQYPVIIVSPQTANQEY